MVRYHYIPSIPKDAYMGKYGGLEKRHTITIAFPDETRYHEYRDNKIELSSLSVVALSKATRTDTSTIH